MKPWQYLLSIGLGYWLYKNYIAEKTVTIVVDQNMNPVSVTAV